MSTDKYCPECMAAPCLQEGEGDPPRMHIKHEEGDEDPPFERTHIKDPCEYNPKEKRAAYENEVHAEAEIILGWNGDWRLCKECASLKKFNHYTTRKPITKKYE